ncbi:hypothetical protein DY000_02011185 [Brassica cretica]|uniref:Uncharacterized protein n=1 Tax=Brassica cretica TaxID=69181 RepID=A0ABQ7DB04_BRACR|nr:hypothetical protein DY000_02011185 [Brassica cretica]
MNRQLSPPPSPSSRRSSDGGDGSLSSTYASSRVVQGTILNKTEKESHQQESEDDEADGEDKVEIAQKEVSAAVFGRTCQKERGRQ